MKPLHQFILWLVGSGFREKEIAGTFGISEKLVQYHIGQVKEKLRLPSHSQTGYAVNFTRAAWRLGLIRSDTDLCQKKNRMA
jgi:DNA-binding NarL/FixJ family response regulator